MIWVQYCEGQECYCVIVFDTHLDSKVTQFFTKGTNFSAINCSVQVCGLRVVPAKSGWMWSGCLVWWDLPTTTTRLTASECIKTIQIYTTKYQIKSTWQPPLPTAKRPNAYKSHRSVCVCVCVCVGLSVSVFVFVKVNLEVFQGFFRFDMGRHLNI